MSLFTIKLIALLAMTLDHLAIFFPYVKHALLFHWIGRIAAPVFIWGIINGMKHTSDKKKYVFRLYTCSIIMSVIQTIWSLDLNFFRLLFFFALLLYLHEENREYLKYFCIYQFFGIILFYIMMHNIAFSSNISGFFTYIIPAIFGLCFNMEGGLLYVALGILMYMAKEKRHKLILYISFWCFIYTLAFSYPFAEILWHKLQIKFSLSSPAFTDVKNHLFTILYRTLGLDEMHIGGNLIYENYSFLAFFSLPLILFYNGKRGCKNKYKYFFYIYYPLHIIVLKILSCR